MPTAIELAFARARAAAFVPPVRNCLWEGGIVSYRLPNDAREGSYPSGDGRKPYWQALMGVPGGPVRIFVHGPQDLRGRRIVARMKVMTKEVGGTLSIYVDLFPVEDQEVTHIVALVPVGSSPRGTVHEVIKTPAPLSGLVVIGGLDLKVDPPAAGTPLPSKRSAVAPGAKWDRRKENKK